MSEAPRQMSADMDCGIARDRLRVFVDGDMVRDVLAYDCDAGWLACLVHDDEGNRMMDGESWLYKRIYGAITVRVI